MSVFNPDKLFMKYLSPANSMQPIVGRKYTLTHSDKTGQIFLDIGYEYNEKAVNPTLRDEVRAEWRLNWNRAIYLSCSVYVDSGEVSKEASDQRFNIFMKEMDTALKGIILGDRQFFTIYTNLLDAPIYIHFQSSFPKFNRSVYFGTPRHYLYVRNYVKNS